MADVYDFSATTIAGEERKLAEYRDQVMLIVNVASQCGSTPQYAGLEELYRRHQHTGLVVLGFPCDQFGNQEPGDEAEIAEFCSRTYDVTFPMFAKIAVNGDEAHPLYKWLKAEKGQQPDEPIAWNFTKFLVSRDGTVLERFTHKNTPDQIAPKVADALC